MSKGYVIVEIGYEYNDEVYQSVGEGGRARTFFTDKARADEVCTKMNFDAVHRLMSSQDISSYGYSRGEIYGRRALRFLESKMDDLGYEELAETVGDTSVSDWDDNPISTAFYKLTPEDQKEFVYLMELKFFLVQTVEVDNG